jgi:hypothetical protein
VARLEGRKERNHDHCGNLHEMIAKPPMSRILFASIALLTCGTAIGEPRTVQIEIGATRFCVPAESLIDAPDWISNDSKQMKHDGVAFTFIHETLPPDLHYEPALNIFGKAMPISGTLGPRRNDEWLSKLPASSYWRQLAEEPNATIDVDVDAHQIRAFQTAARDRWMIWTIDPAFPVAPTSIEKGGSILALCHRTDFRDIGVRRIDETVTCNRRAARDDLFLSYTFGGQNVRNIAALDEAVWRIVRSWRCRA